MTSKKEKIATLNKKLNEQTKEQLKKEGVDIKPFQLEPATAFFKDELSAIKNQQLNSFFVNIMQAAPASFYKDQRLMEEVQKAYHLLRVSLSNRKVAVPDEFVDAVSGAILIAKILKNETMFQGAYQALYASATRLFIQEKGYNESLPVGLYENIMRIVESHDDNAVISPLLEARQGTAEAEVALFFSLAKSEMVVYAAPAKEETEDAKGK